MGKAIIRFAIYILASLLVLAALGLIALFVISWSMNYGEYNEVVVQNDSSADATQIVVSFRDQQHKITLIPNGETRSLKAPAGPEGTVSISVTVRDQILKCSDGYITSGISSRTFARLKEDGTIHCEFTYPEITPTQAAE